MIIKVDNRLRISRADLPGNLEEMLKAEFTYKNPKHAAAEAMGFFTREPRLIESWHVSRDELSLPRGATQAVRTVLARHGIGEPDWIDSRTEGTLSRPGYTHRVILWDHQETAVQAMLETENCLIRAPTGSGKTTAAIAAICRINLPALVVVWSTRLFDQWIERLVAELGISKKEIGTLGGGGKRRLLPVTMAMQQTLYRDSSLMQQVSDSFGVVIADEVQRFAAKTFTSVIDRLTCRYRIGISADHRRKDRMEFLIQDQFGKVAAEIKEADLIDRSLVLDVEIVVVPTETQAEWFCEQKRMFSVNKTQAPDFGRLLGELAIDAKRNEIVERIWNDEITTSWNQVLVFTHRREHAYQLVRRATMANTRCGLLLGGKESKDEFRETIGALKRKELFLAVGTYQAVGAAIDLPSVSRGIASTPITSNRQFVGQVRGRLCRCSAGKKDAVLYYLWDRHIFGFEPLVNLVRWNTHVFVLGPDGRTRTEARVYLKSEMKHDAL